MLKAALRLAEKGLCVFPCQVRGKAPATQRGCLDASTDAEILRQWWQQNPQYNIGIATGQVSGIFVVDIDGIDAELELRKLESEHGSTLPATIEAITPRGRHAYFAMPNMPVRNSAGKIAPGIDVRGDGGYVLCPPSVGPTGKKYAWSVDSASAFAPAPEWLLTKINGNVNGNGKAPTPSSEWRALAEESIAEGRRNHTITKLTGHLLRRYVDPFIVLQLMQSFNATHCVPPLSAQDVARVVDSIAGRELRRRG